MLRITTRITHAIWWLKLAREHLRDVIRKTPVAPSPGGRLACHTASAGVGGYPKRKSDKKERGGTPDDHGSRKPQPCHEGVLWRTEQKITGVTYDPMIHMSTTVARSKTANPT